MHFKAKALLTAIVFIPSLLLGDYWQQQVDYDINVTLIDTLHQVKGHETITYINNSPDELNFIWMHLWPNAYKNNESALAKQKFNQFSTKMWFLPDSSFGWIEISDVSANGAALNWEYRSADTLDVAKFFLNETLSPGDTISLSLDFTVKVPNVLSRLGHFGNHYEITQWYPKPAVYDQKGWHPMSYLDQGEFYSEWGNFQVSITLPKNYRVAATGVLQDSTEISWRDSLAQIGNAYLDSFKMEPKPKLPGLKTLIKKKPASDPEQKTITFKQNDVHDFAWFADKRFMIMHDTLSFPSGKVTQLWTFALPQDLKNYRYSNDYIGASVNYFSEWFMEYPYEHATVVDGDFSAGGGMEYPMITLINNTALQPLLELTIIHEVGHNWFYGLSGSNERDYPWMDEGLNSYAENRYWAAKYTDNSMLALHGEKPSWYPLVEYFFKDLSKSAIEDLAYYSSALPKVDQPPNLNSEAFTSSNYGMMVYKKSALATGALHRYLGESMMDSVWHAYFQRWAFKHPQPEDIRQVFESVTGEDLSWYFDDMLGSTAYLDYALDDFNSIARGAAFETTVRIANQGDYSPPLPIRLTGKSPDVEKTVWVRPTGDHDVLQIKTDFPVTDVKLDPDLVFPDINRANNDKNINLDFDLLQLALNTQADYVITIIPYIWYDSVDLISPGLILTHKNLISWGTDWYFRGFVGPVTKAPGFTASVGKKIFPMSGRTLYMHVRMASDWYYRLAELSSTSTFRNTQYTRDNTSLRLSLLAQDLTDPEIVIGNDTISYFDPEVWNAEKFLKASIAFEKKTHRTLWSQQCEIRGMIGSRTSGNPYGKIQAYFKHSSKYSRKGSIISSVFAGAAFGNLPQQDRFYLSTSVDPELKNKLIMSRRYDWYTPGHTLVFPTVYTIPGYLYSSDSNLTPSTLAIIGAKAQANLPKLEMVSVLAGMGLIMEENGRDWRTIGSVSTVLKSGPVDLTYTPLRLGTDQIEMDWTRFQIALALDMSTFGIGF